MGGTSASIISFILPGMFIMDTHEDNGRSRGGEMLPLLMVWGGTLIGIVTTYVTIYGLCFPAERSNTDTCKNY
jgi:Na+-driven multidrug efflux pump